MNLWLENLNMEQRLKLLFAFFFLRSNISNAREFQVHPSFDIERDCELKL